MVFVYICCMFEYASLRFPFSFYDEYYVAYLPVFLFSVYAYLRAVESEYEQNTNLRLVGLQAEALPSWPFAQDPDPRDIKVIYHDFDGWQVDHSQIFTIYVGPVSLYIRYRRGPMFTLICRGSSNETDGVSRRYVEQCPDFSCHE